MYVQKGTLLLVDAFENFRNICLEIYESFLRTSANLLTAPRLAWKTASERTKVKLDLLTDIYMLLIAEKGIRGGKHAMLFICM